MEIKTKVFEVRQTAMREDVKKERLIFELKEYENTGESEWVYHAPNAQDHTQEQVEIILEKLKELNKGVKEDG